MTYVSGINHGRETEVLRLRTNVRHEFDSRGDNTVFFNNLVIMYWTLNSIYMQFG